MRSFLWVADPRTKQKVVDYSYNSRDTLVLMDSFGPAQQNYSTQDLIWKSPLITFFFPNSFQSTNTDNQ